jgi:hypothetical protein
MAISKTTEFVDITIKANKQVIVNVRYTIDDPDDNELPIEAKKSYVLVESSDISEFSEAIQAIINAAWDAL